MAKLSWKMKKEYKWFAAVWNLLGKKWKNEKGNVVAKDPMKKWKELE